MTHEKDGDDANGGDDAKTDNDTQNSSSSRPHCVSASETDATLTT